MKIVKLNLLWILPAMLIGCGRAADDIAPFRGVFVMQSNGFAPLIGVSKQGAWSVMITNVVTVTNGSVIVSYLQPPEKKHAVRAGQYWIVASAVYLNTPRVHRWPSNEFLPEHFSTNHWPEVVHHCELIYVRAIENYKAGLSKGEPGYAICRVRFWGEGFTEANAPLSISSLSNNATLLRDAP